jgi:hypothetical protein
MCDKGEVLTLVHDDVFEDENLVSDLSWGVKKQFALTTVVQKSRVILTGQWSLPM